MMDWYEEWRWILGGLGCAGAAITTSGTERATWAIAVILCVMAGEL